MIATHNTRPTCANERWANEARRITPPPAPTEGGAPEAAIELLFGLILSKQKLGLRFFKNQIQTSKKKAAGLAECDTQWSYRIWRCLVCLVPIILRQYFITLYLGGDASRTANSTPSYDDTYTPVRWGFYS